MVNEIDRGQASGGVARNHRPAGDRPVVPVNPAGSVRGPSHTVKTGKTPVLTPVEARALIDSIDTTTLAGLRDRALIGLIVFSFARIGAAVHRAPIA